MYVCIDVCICIQLYIYIYIHPYIHMYKHTHTYARSPDRSCPTRTWCPTSPCGPSSRCSSTCRRPHVWVILSFQQPAFQKFTKLIIFQLHGLHYTLEYVVVCLVSRCSSTCRRPQRGTNGVTAKVMNYAI